MWALVVICKPKEDFVFDLIKGNTKLRLPQPSTFIRFHNPNYKRTNHLSEINTKDLPDISYEFENAIDALLYADALINFVLKRKINIDSKKERGNLLNILKQLVTF